MNSHRRDHIQSFLVDERAEVQTRLALLTEAFSAMERTFNEMIARLCESGSLDPEEPFIQRWQKALDYLKRQGLKSTPLPGEPAEPTTKCPKCKSVLKNIGKPGDRCDWCGHIFPLECPSCKKILDKIRGESGDICLWCHHQF